MMQTPRSKCPVTSTIAIKYPLQVYNVVEVEITDGDFTPTLWMPESSMVSCSFSTSQLVAVSVSIEKLPFLSVLLGCILLLLEHSQRVLGLEKILCSSLSRAGTKRTSIDPIFFTALRMISYYNIHILEFFLNCAIGQLFTLSPQLE